MLGCLCLLLLCLTFLSQSLSVNREPPVWTSLAGQGDQDPLVSTPKPVLPTPALTWRLGIQAQTFALDQ